ncbi:hypothetical protein F5Y11DRAFT_344066 [Daldinia sp. FL1419]|nr:hypothetical protein F5Y11DRAFT_344066 [Daldinia sp. FL1419]
MYMIFHAQTHLNCGELVVDPVAANAETPGSCPGSCATEAVVEEVELGRDIGSRVAGNGTVPSSMTDLIGGNAGDAVRDGIGEVIGGRLLSACNDASVVDAVVGKFSRSRVSSGRKIAVKTRIEGGY